jgi:flavin reductase
MNILAPVDAGLAQGAAPAVANGADGFHEFFRHQLSTVAIVTAGEGPKRAGLTLTTLCALMSSPPSLIASIERDSRVSQMIVRSRRFGVSLLHEQQRDLADAFRGRPGDTPDAEPKFRAGGWISGPSGIPLLGDCLGRAVCDVFQSYAFGTHVVFIGTMQYIDVPAAGDRRPLLD